MKKSSVWLGAAALSLGLFTPLSAGAQTTTASPILAKKGAIVNGTLQQTLSSKTNKNGDTFTLIEKDTFWHKNAALNGDTIEGHLENVSPAGPTHKATMTVIFDDIKLSDGTRLPIHADIVSVKIFEPKTHHIRDAGIIIGTAVMGHMAANKAGMQHGGLAGAAAGFALVSTMKSDIVVKQGTVVGLKLKDNVTSAAQ